MRLTRMFAATWIVAAVLSTAALAQTPSLTSYLDKSDLHTHEQEQGSVPTISARAVRARSLLGTNKLLESINIESHEWQQPAPSPARTQHKLVWSQTHPWINKTIHIASQVLYVGAMSGDGFLSASQTYVVRQTITGPVEYREGSAMFRAADGIGFRSKKYFSVFGSIDAGSEIAEDLTDYDPIFDTARAALGGVLLKNVFGWRAAINSGPVIRRVPHR